MIHQPHPIEKIYGDLFQNLYIIYALLLTKESLCDLFGVVYGFCLLKLFGQIIGSTFRLCPISPKFATATVVELKLA